MYLNTLVFFMAFWVLSTVLLTVFHFKSGKESFHNSYFPYSIMLMLFIKTPLTLSSIVLIFYITPYTDLL